MKLKLKKPLSLLAGMLAILSVVTYIIENKFTFLVLALNTIAMILFIIDNRRINKK
jgi:hypothetical protein